MLGYTPRTDDSIDVKAVRLRVGKISDAELVQFGKAAQYMCSPNGNMGKPPRQVFVIQLEETWAEWRRRQASKKLIPAELFVDKE